MTVKEPNIYCSIAAPGFPNYFVINGPGGNWGQGCALPSVSLAPLAARSSPQRRTSNMDIQHEVQIEYALQCVKKLQEEGVKAIEVRQKPTTDLQIHMNAWHKKYSVWSENCKR
jgi:hypothetical protein